MRDLNGAASSRYYNDPIISGFCMNFFSKKMDTVDNPGADFVTLT